MPVFGHTEHVSPRLQSATTRLTRTRFRTFMFVGIDCRMPEDDCMTRFSVRGPWANLYADIWSKCPRVLAPIIPPQKSIYGNAGKSGQLVDIYSHFREEENGNRQLALDTMVILDKYGFVLQYSDHDQ